MSWSSVGNITGDVLVFWGTLHVTKVWVKLDWTREIVRWDHYVTITVTSESFYLDSWPPGPGLGAADQDWDRIGTTTHFKREGFTIELECILPYRVYFMKNPTLKAYQIYNRVKVFSGDGSEAISTVKMITPVGAVYDMMLEETYEYYSIYTHRMDLHAPLLGLWRFRATDSQGNTAETSFDVSSWINVVPESVIVTYDPSIPKLEWDITWPDDPETPEFEHYECSLFAPSGDEWWGEWWGDEMPLVYYGPPLTETGYYKFYIYAVMSIPGVIGGEVQIIGDIYIGPPTPSP